MSWAAAMLERHAGGQLIAVSHRDPIAVSLLHWMGKDLEELPEFPLAPGGVYKVCLETAARAVQVEALG